MNWNRRTAAWAGLALLVVTNAVALGGAAANRGGGPDSRVRLTERELDIPYGFRAGRSEDSGMSLRLNWRSLQRMAGFRDGLVLGYEGGNMPVWLDVPKMVSLGFAAPDPADVHAVVAGVRPSTRFERQPRREVMIVLEMDGPAYREALRRAEERLKARQAARENDTPRKEGGTDTGLDDARDTLARERAAESRLFAIDAGLDSAALRARYPDRAMYAIVRAQVRPRPHFDGQADGGTIVALDVGSVNVPLALRPVFEAASSSAHALTPDTRLHFAATVAVGQRLEPWLVEAARRAWPAPQDAAAAH